MGKRIETKTFTLPAYWASTLINGDSSGISDADDQDIMDWLEETGKEYPAFYCSGCGPMYWFSWHNDANNLGGNVMEFTFIIND